MTCPPEIASILLRMMTHGLLAIRACPNDPPRCLVFSDHLHNLPGLVGDFSPEKLSYYWDVERPCFIRQVAEADRRIFEPLWEELLSHVESWGPDRRTGYLVVIEKAESGSYHAFVPDLPGCVGVGDTPWETAIEIREALGWHVASLRRHNEPVPPPSATGQFVMIDPP